MADRPAIKGIKGLIAGINLPISIPPQPYLSKNASPFLIADSLFLIKLKQRIFF